MSIRPADAVTWVHGKHTLKFGGELDKFDYDVLAGLRSGSFTFNGDFYGRWTRRFPAGRCVSAVLPERNTERTHRARARRSRFFGQRTYHISRTVTLNLEARR